MPSGLSSVLDLSVFVIAGYSWYFRDKFANFICFRVTNSMKVGYDEKLVHQFSQFQFLCHMSPFSGEVGVYYVI